MTRFQPFDHIAGAFSLTAGEKEIFISLSEGKAWEPGFGTPSLLLLTEPSPDGGRRISPRISTFLSHPQLSPQNNDIYLYYPEMGVDGLYFDKEGTEPLSRLVRFAKDNDGAFLICLRGAHGAGRRTLIRFASYQNGLAVLFAELPKCDADLNRIKIESLLMGAAICFCNVMFEETGELKALASKLHPAVKLVFFTSEKLLPELDDDRYFIINLPMPPMDAIKRQKVFVQVSADFPIAGDLDPPDSFTPRMMRSALRAAFANTVAEKGDGISRVVFVNACRQLHEEKMAEYGVIVKPVYGWDELILTKEQKSLLRSISNRMRNSHIVYERWGFGDRMPYGTGLKLLMAGPPGTGKTMAAIVLANETALPLLKIDTSAMMSKYIGETEKNLRRIFDTAAETSYILLFDEADSLFGKRSEVKDSHDRYANLQTSFLLQKIEEYNGTVILTTNLFQNFDEAFRRRFHYIVQFTMPGRESRKMLWENVFPRQTPLDSGIDFEFLAEKFEFSGGSIKNIALASAFYAAAESDSVHMSHILRALAEECEKIGHPVSENLLSLH